MNKTCNAQCCTQAHKIFTNLSLCHQFHNPLASIIVCEPATIMLYHSQYPKPLRKEDFHCSHTCFHFSIYSNPRARSHSHGRVLTLLVSNKTASELNLPGETKLILGETNIRYP